MKVGFVGLGKMGGRMASRLIVEGHDLIVWNRSQAPIEELRIKAQNLRVAKSIEDLIRKLDKPRVVWVMLPAHSAGSGQAGNPTEEILKEILKYVEKEDIVIDGGNSNFKDTERRYKKLSAKEIKFLGIGVSGGIIAEKAGYPLMVGGNKSGYEYIKPILDSLAKPTGGHEYFGEGGAGHFVKMIHNGIEYGIMQSLGEGFEVLQKAPYKFDLLSVAKLWQKGTLVSGFMLDRAVEALTKDPSLSNVSGFIESSGEADWTVDQAKEEKVEVEIIERSLDYRKRSRVDLKIQNSFTAKMINALRNAFGGHEVKKN